jgi:glycosyltransferase involved in cell wall biosynthesis
MFGHLPYTIIRNGIDTTKYAFNVAVRQQLRESLSLNNCFVIGHVGRFVKAKNHDMLIHVFAKVVTEIENCRLLLIGEGELQEYIKQQAKILSIYHKVLFLNNRMDVPELLQAMDLFAFPSLFEGLPIAMVEAQAAGLRCLCSDKVSSEMSLSNQIEFLPLDRDLWIKKILYLFKSNKDNFEQRCYGHDNVQNAGYDIKETSKLLLALYSTNQ